MEKESKVECMDAQCMASRNKEILKDIKLN